MKYLTDDDFYHSVSKFDSLDSPLPWNQASESDHNTFAHFFCDKYYHHFRGWWDCYVPLQVNMSSSPGHSWKHLFKTKRDFYDDPRHIVWLRDFLYFSHYLNWIEPYTASLKEELTLEESIAAGKCRLFYIAGVITDFVVKFLCRNFNAALKDTDFCMVGFVAEYGGVTDFREDVELFVEKHPDTVITEDDCSKFDLGRDERSFDTNLSVRKQLQAPSLRVHNAVLGHCYKNARLKYLIWLDGAVIVCYRGNPSGWPNTSEDNSFDHLHMKFAVVVLHMGYTPEAFLRSCMFNIVSDDGLCVVPLDCAEPSINAMVHAKYGRIWKGHPRPVSRSLIGREFCSIRFLPTSHVVALEKVYNSANFRIGLTEEEYKMKLQSLAVLLAGDPTELHFFNLWLQKSGYWVDEQRALSIAHGYLF